MDADDRDASSRRPDSSSPPAIGPADAAVEARLRCPRPHVMEGERRDEGIRARQGNAEKGSADQRRTRADSPRRERRDVRIRVDADDRRLPRPVQTPGRQRTRADSQIDNGSRVGGDDGGRGVEHLVVAGDEGADAVVVLGQPDAEMRGDAHGLTVPPSVDSSHRDAGRGAPRGCLSVHGAARRCPAPLIPVVAHAETVRVCGVRVEDQWLDGYAARAVG